jgi:aminopeptidase N
MSVSGKSLPVTFWVLPEDYDKGAGLAKQVKEFLSFYEEYLGPYPFRDEKLGIAQTKHLGMEHQTIIAYGNNFKNNDDGFDGLMLHELGHEWWGNMVTASDWRDMWLHEGFQSFMDTLYVERLHGKDAYLKSMSSRMKSLRNKQPVAPRESRTTTEIYMAGPDYLNSDGDIYGKGAVILHTLRYLIGDKAFFKALRTMAYPDPRMEKLTDGHQTRFANTDDFLHIVEKESGMELGWFFEVYLRHFELPKLISETSGNQVRLRWEVPNGLSFPMPIEVKVGDMTKRIEMPDGVTSVVIKPGQTVVADPLNWILKAQ